MKIKIIYLLLLFCTLSFPYAVPAQSLPEIEFSQLKLRPGDVILLSLNCYVCRLIEAEEGLPYSHSGIVLYDPTVKELGVAQALNGVAFLPLSQFLSQRKNGSHALVLRSQELEQLAQLSLTMGARISSFTQLTSAMWQSFDKQFKGKAFDAHFLWDNQDQEGGELLYCSEFVAKLLNTVLAQKILPRPMHFERQRAGWEIFFRKQVPDGLPGLAPSDFARRPDFFVIGEI